MLKPVYTRQFERDVKRLQRRGKDTGKLKEVVRVLLAEEPLDPRRRDHKLIGSYQGRRECHIEPDWLLIYKREADAIIFERSGTHADLFRE
ncbi:MAG: type II toxin-antitoxin system YafQ family toxin [Planctomycetes bacterium]|nr:type II toxin-antitoxin system YafQ family toxin [Planctomycetota bacterium]